jgi:hypothetical protein
MTVVEYVALIAGKLIKYAERTDQKEMRPAAEWAKLIKAYHSNFD